MQLNQIEDIVDHHRQLERDSCSPSLAEMLLKIDGAVPPGYYAEQERDKNNNVGLTNIKDKTIAGRTFRRLQDTPSPQPFHERIDGLLATERPVGIYLPMTSGFHGFVVAAKQDGNYLLLSKCSELGHGEGRVTLKVLLAERELDASHDRDCIYILPIA